MTRAVPLAGVILAAVLSPRDGWAQQPSSPTLELHALQQAAVAADPRGAELQLFNEQSALRLKNLAVLRLPTIGADAQAQYQSDVATAPLAGPGGRPLFAPPKATYDSAIRIDQRLFDPAIAAQTALERAQLAEQQARLQTALYAVRQSVNEAFFAAAALHQRANTLAAAIADLEGRLREMEARVREGAAVPADAAAVEATLLQRRQEDDELRANRRAALARLGTLTGRAIGEDASPVLPDLAARVAAARASLATLRARPEYAQFARMSERLARQREAVAAQARPKASAFGRVGYGRPGLNFIQGEFETYGLGGVRIQWNAWTWGTTGREREALALQQRVVAADEAAFARGLAEAIEGDLASIDRLQRALTLDERIVALRREVERMTQVRLQEGVVTASEYLARSAELLQARVAYAGHEVELAQASARLLTTLGLEVR